MPPVAILALSGFTAVLQSAPAIEELVTKAKDFFTSMAGNGLITDAQQDALHARVDAIVAAAQEGKLPADWDVEPDPQ